MAGDSLNIAVAQFGFIDGEKKDNLNKALHYMVRAAAEGADIVILPEMFLTGFPVEIPMAQLAETMPGDSMLKLQESAVKNGIAVAGSMPEWDENSKTSFNTCFYINRGGKLLGKYRKIQLFNREKNYVSAGNSLTVVEDGGIRYGLLICYDLEFPEIARTLAEGGAQVLLVPSANMEPYGLFHRLFTQARAIENHQFVAYCNRTGQNRFFTFCGGSCLANPFGEIVADLAQEEGLMMATARLDLISQSKELYNYLDERKVFFKSW